MLASVLINGSNMSFPRNIIYGVLANIRLQSAMGEVLGELMFSLGTLGVRVTVAAGGSGYSSSTSTSSFSCQIVV